MSKEETRNKLGISQNQLRIGKRMIKDKVTGKEMRKWAIERLAQTKKRIGKDEPRKKRQKSTNTLDYLREAADRSEQ